MIIKVKKTKDYAAIDNKVLCDKRLSYRARGVLAYLLSKPNNWQVVSEDVIDNGTEGRDAIRACFRELKAFGYARLVGVEGGGRVWIICEEPEDESLKTRLSGKPEKPESLKNAPNKVLKKKGAVQKTDSATKKSDSGCEQLIYDAYPKHVGKPAALRAIKTALKKFKKEDHALSLLEVTRLYAKSLDGADPQFIPNPATWFNQERYNDNPVTWPPRADKKASTKSVINASNTNRDAVGDY
jgi:hypothetical protein